MIWETMDTTMKEQECSKLSREDTAFRNTWYGVNRQECNSDSRRSKKLYEDMERYLPIN